MAGSPPADCTRSRRVSYDGRVQGPRSDDWCALSDESLPVDEVRSWAERPDCGAVVVFVGNARDHAPGREDVVELAYEAYEEHVIPSLERSVAAVRAEHPGLGRVAALHRVGRLAVGDTAVVVAVSSPHRAAAFAAAAMLIDDVKATAPIWKKERWRDGSDWGFTDSDLGVVGRR